MSDISKRPLVIFHKDCFDGFTAAWVFRKFMGEDVEYHAAAHGTEPPDTKGRRVWLLDFCYDRETMITKVIIPSMRTTVWDHHKTSEAALDKILEEVAARGVQRYYDKVIFDMNRSGAGITYDELEAARGRKIGRHEPRYNGMRKDWIIDYIEDRDLWRFKHPRSEAVSAWISTVPMTMEDWDELAAKDVQKVADMGEAIRIYIANYSNKICEHATYRQLGGYVVPVINVPYMNSSEHIGLLADLHPESPFAAGFFLRGDGAWQFGLRARNTDFDVSEVAKGYVFNGKPGGGHAAAAGFQCHTLPWGDEPPMIKPEIVEALIEGTEPNTPADEEVSFDED